jgi:hypothetical protein
MSTAWWEITSAVAFGGFVLWWPLYRQFGVHLGQGAGPGMAALVQAVVLWLAGTSFGGVMISLIAGGAVLPAVMRAERWHRERQERRADEEES